MQKAARSPQRRRAGVLIKEWLILFITMALSTLLAWFVIRQVLHPYEQIKIFGSGSSFVAPIFARWSESYMQSLPLNAPLVKYTPSSSQQGINDLRDNITLFSVTEDPDAVVQDQTFAFPITVGGVALIYNLNANLSAPLILTRDIIVGIFNSTITAWDDERIARLNPTIASHVRFKAIRPYHRTTLSGTTYMFTQALSSFSPEWNRTYGSGMNVDWPFQQTEAIPSNADMITAVSFRPFSIGYVGIGDLDSDDISGGRGNIRVSYIQNRAGNQTFPSVADISAAVADAGDEFLRNHYLSPDALVDRNCSTCYPLAGFSFAIMQRHYFTRDSVNATLRCSSVKAMVQFFQWILLSGAAEKEAVDQNYLLPPRVLSSILAPRLWNITCDGVPADTIGIIFPFEWLAAGSCVAIILVVGIVRLALVHRVCSHSPTNTSSPLPSESEPLLSRELEVKINPRINKPLVGQDELELIEPIGKGSFGEVYKANWKGVLVAVKRLMTGGDKTGLEAFMKEASLMSTLRHPNIVFFLAASIKPPHVYIITELCAKGSLYDVLQAATPNSISGKMRKQFALDAALGMLYLHSEQLIHRDLKTNNLLVTESNIVKVADFGTSRVVSEDRTMTQCGTVTYAAPEIFSRHGRVTHKVDVFSYGIVLWDILCAPEELYPGLTMFDVVDEVSKQGLRPPLDRIRSPLLQELMVRCWAADPAERPEFAQIVSALREIPGEHFVATPSRLRT